ncbi:MAG: patatin-like phospholipase family protein [bacterium]|nr:patatin-like phospholipase family protein [bacterium]
MALKVGLALGGGASRGLAHLGVLKALVEAKIPIDLITGVSIGGIIGSIFAAHPEIDTSITNIRRFLNSEDFNQTRLDFIKESKQQSKSYYDQFKRLISTGFFFAISSTRSSFISQETFEWNLSHLIPKIDLEDCPIPLGLVAMDLHSGKEKDFLTGKMMQAVMATAAIPGVFPPIEIDQRRFVDGSWLVPVPVALARKMGADLVIAVDVAPTLSQDQGPQEHLSGWDVQLRASEASRMGLKECCMAGADHRITVDIMDLHWADFTRLDLCLKRGEAAAIRSLEAIERAIYAKRWRRRFGFN